MRPPAAPEESPRAAPLPRSLAALDFASARAPELRAVLAECGEALPPLPRRLRRRATSHAPRGVARKRVNAARAAGLAGALPPCRAARRRALRAAAEHTRDWHARRFLTGPPLWCRVV